MEEEKSKEETNHEENIHDSLYEEYIGEESGQLAKIDFNLRAAGRWLLKVIGGPNNGAEFSMQADHTYIVGTDPNTADIVFHDTSVSRQHAKITIAKDERITIEDLNSRNGVLLDGDKISSPQILESNTLVSVGTTSFIIYDREGEMQTIISPLLPSIVKVLQKGEGNKEEVVEEKKVETPVQPSEPVEEKTHNVLGAFILIGIITGFFVIVGIGTTTLFRSEPVIQEEVDYTQELTKALAPFPSVTWTYNKKTGSLFLVGHVLTASDRSQLLFNLQGLPFLKVIDDKGIVNDENVWREINNLIARRPEWKGINVSSPKPGKFVISGFLQAKKEADQLSDYLSANFQYTDLLEWRVIVEEEVLSQVTSQLENSGIRSVKASMTNGELSLSGGIEADKRDEFNQLIQKFRNIPGVHNVRNYVTNVAPEATMVNISNKYVVTGYSHQGGSNLTVVINGRILSRGDSLDGMIITSIKPNVIFLEKEGVRYRIDYNQ